MKSIFLFTALFFGAHSFSSISSVSTNVSKLSDKIKADEAIHRIQLGEFTEYVPVKFVELMRQIGGVKPISKNGVSTYYSAAIESEEVAAKLLPKYISYGFDDARHVVEYQNNIYSLRQFNVLKTEGKLPKNDKIPVVRIWK